MATIGTRRPVRKVIELACPHCGKRLMQDQLTSGEQTCRNCGTSFESFYYEPPVRKVRVQELAGTGPKDGTVCAKHERNVAVGNCERCGNFMCGLCKIDTDGMALCPPCFERMAAEGALPSATGNIKNYAGIASLLCAVGLFLYCLFVFTIPAIYYAVKAIKQKREMNETEGMASAIGILIVSILQTIAGLAVIGAFIYQATKR